MMTGTVLRDRVAVVTGGGRGIGEAVAAALGIAGADVAVWDLDRKRAESTANRLVAENGRRVVGIEVNVADHVGVDAAVVLTEQELGPIDILVNNAGIDVIGPFLDSDPELWDRIIEVNLRGPITTCHRIVRDMVERGRGRVVNLGSDAGKVGSSGEAVCSATKGGVIAFTKTLAREVAANGITVNCVWPGRVRSSMTRWLGQSRSSGSRSRATSHLPSCFSPATTRDTSLAKPCRSAGA